MNVYPQSYPDVLGSLTWPPVTVHQHPSNLPSLSAPEAPLDQMYQFRTTTLPHQDDDDAAASQADSSAMSSFFDVDDTAYQQSLDHRRRASMNGGVWATAFNNMSLHDSAGNLIPNPPGLPLAPTTMFTPSQLQMDAAKRPSLSAINGNSYTDASGRMPSMSDVKDLWKLYMADPLTGPTPSKEKSTLDFGNSFAAQPMQTPRPGMGNRTLSKSNSMPDLKSPPLFGNQAFFTGAQGAARGGPGGQDGAMPNVHLPPRLDGGEVSASDTAALKVWQDRIKHRQASFTIAMQHPGPMGRRANSKGESTSRSGSIPAGGSAADERSEFPFATSQSPDAQMSYADYSLLSSTASNPQPIDYTSRPVASVFQRNQALNQTLGPERAPSFGLQGQLYDPVGGITPTNANFPRGMSQYQQQYPHMQHQPQQPLAPPPPLSQYHTRHPAMPIPSGLTKGQAVNAVAAASSGKVTSAFARPGNKRLASQSLVGQDGKKASFLLFEGQQEGEEAVDEPELEGTMGYAGAGSIGAGIGGVGSVVPVLPAEWQTTNA